jgi:hypothetical protein
MVEDVAFNSRDSPVTGTWQVTCMGQGSPSLDSSTAISTFASTLWGMGGPKEAFPVLSCLSFTGVKKYYGRHQDMATAINRTSVSSLPIPQQPPPVLFRTEYRGIVAPSFREGGPQDSLSTSLAPLVEGGESVSPCGVSESEETGVFTTPSDHHTQTPLVPPVQRGAMTREGSARHLTHVGGMYEYRAQSQLLVWRFLRVEDSLKERVSRPGCHGCTS